MDAITMNSPASQGQVLVSIDAWGPGYWAEMSGGEVSADAKEVWDGGAEQPLYISGKAKTSNLVIKKPYKPGQDKSRIEEFARKTGKLRATITVQDTDPEFGVVFGKPRVYANALLQKVTMPVLKAGSSDENVIETEWAVSGMAL